jgi:hypothetical protein
MLNEILLWATNAQMNTKSRLVIGGKPDIYLSSPRGYFGAVDGIT